MPVVETIKTSSEDVIVDNDNQIVVEPGNMDEDFARDCACSASDDNPYN